MTSLIITNGDSAADLLNAAGKQGVIEPWRDCLHLGPVPATDSDADLRNIRAAYLADMSDRDKAEILTELEARDGLFEMHKKFDTIELWFEHDLFDQLQLIQILDMLAIHGRLENVFLVQAETYLGMKTPDNILDLADLTQPVSKTMVADARGVWAAFRESDPKDFAACFQLKYPEMPHLRLAIGRMLEELPGIDGLNRTERQILFSIQRGVTRPGPLFARTMAMEEGAFWGDTGFFALLSKLATGTIPLFNGLSEPFTPSLLEDDERRKTFITSEIELTDAGEAVLAGDKDHADINQIDTWIGGTHVTNDNLWRWDPAKRTLTT
ncbi:MAG: DUF1835 domain-containing protein [Rhizobiales bacterium]|nr:DUF1835 domain-containing protein [Hyphomicrobiales bacterium]